MKILFLYTEIADYVLACLKELASEGVDVHVVRWPINSEAPFQFNDSQGVQIYNKSEYSLNELSELVEGINPSIIVCSGWMDKDYLKITKRYSNKIPTVLTMDNHWRGDVKQIIATLISPFWLKKIFSNCWVPGKPQRKFAEKLGFNDSQIRERFYVADTRKFSNFHSHYHEEKLTNYPKRLLYIGRYVQHKGIYDMWNAFTQLQEEKPNDWELWCLGTGEDYEKRINHPKIKHFGFIQPSEMGEYLKQTGVYILPSHFEPWGVSVHEMAAAGFPLLLSDKVGSGEAFIAENENGFLFQSGNIEELKSKMYRIMNTKDSELISMQKRSVELSLEVTPEKWVKTLKSFIE